MEKYNKILPALYWMSFFGEFTTTMINTVIIIYLTFFGMTSTQIGWILGINGFSYLIAAPLLGKIGDRFSRKGSLILAGMGQIFVAIGFFLIILLIHTENALFVLSLLCMFLLGFVYGFFWPSIEAFISEESNQSSQGHEHGILMFCVSWGMAYVISPWISGLLSDLAVVSAFLIVFICYLVNLGITLFFLPKQSRVTKSTQFTSPSPSLQSNEKISDQLSLPEENSPSKLNVKQATFPSNSPSKDLKSLSFLIFLAVATYPLIAKMILFYFPNYAVLETGLGWTGTLTGIIVNCFGIGRMLFYVIGRKWKIKYSAILQSFGIAILLLFSMLWITSPIVLAINFLISGFFIGRIYFVSLELLLRNEQEGKGKKAGLFESAIGIGSSATPMITGYLADINTKFPFMIFGILALIILSIMFYVYLRKNR